MKDPVKSRHLPRRYRFEEEHVSARTVILLVILVLASWGVLEWARS